MTEQQECSALAFSDQVWSLWAERSSFRGVAKRGILGLDYRAINVHLLQLPEDRLEPF